MALLRTSEDRFDGVLITGPNRDPLRDLIPTASERPDVRVEGAIHFLREDASEEIPEENVAFVDRT